MGRIYTPDGNIASSGGDKGGRPPTMQERIEEALRLWEAKNHDLAFATSLNCVAYMSNGLSGLAKLVQSLEKSVQVLREENKKLQESNAANLKHQLELHQELTALKARLPE